jgi:hypothetical protein
MIFIKLNCIYDVACKQNEFLILQAIYIWLNLYKCATLVFKPFLIVVFGRDTCVAIEGLAFGRALVLFGRTNSRKSKIYVAKQSLNLDCNERS